MGTLANDTIADLLEGRVKFKRNKGLHQAKRVVNHAPEVMVKISGTTTGVDQMKAHLDYTSRDGKVAIEDERGDVLKGKEAVRSLSDDWSQDQVKRRKKTRITTNIVLSMPFGTDPEDLKDAARNFAKRQFGKNHQYVFALHEDAENPHVHLTVKNLGYNGRRLHVKKGDPQRWREAFAAELERQGVEAEATARATRGVIKKAVNQAIRHMRSRGAVPAVDQAKIKEIIEAFNDEKKGKPPRPKPWEAKIKQRQTYVRKAWLTAAKDLNRSGDQEDQRLARNIADFVSSMPPMKTERHEIQERVAAEVNRSAAEKAKKNDRNQDQDER